MDKKQEFYRFDMDEIGTTVYSPSMGVGKITKFGNGFYPVIVKHGLYIVRYTKYGFSHVDNPFPTLSLYPWENPMTCELIG